MNKNLKMMILMILPLLIKLFYLNNRTLLQLYQDILFKVENLILKYKWLMIPLYLVLIIQYKILNFQHDNNVC